MQIDIKSQTITQRLAQLKSAIKACILSKHFITPLFTFYKEFSFDTLRYEHFKKSRLSINLNTVSGITRLLQIIQIVSTLAEKGEFITKRNLYYKLIHYYKVYAGVDNDIEFLTLNLNAVREDLYIVSSSRCILLGNVKLKLDQNQIKCTNKIITNITSYRSIKDSITTCKNLFIIQKQSALIQIYQQLINSFVEDNQPLWFQQSIFISSKGYPDNTCRGIVSNLSPIIDNIYYLGDEDIYGVDILLCYAIGINNFSTILHRINWIDPSQMIDPKLLQSSYQLLSKQDKKKYMEICNRNYLKDLQDFIPKNQNQTKFKKKLLAWKERLTEIKQNNKKIELQSFFKFLKANWIETMIQQKRFL